MRRDGRADGARGESTRIGLARTASLQRREPPTRKRPSEPTVNQRALSIAFGVAFVGATASAHHSIATIYDSSRQATIKGVVVSFQFINSRWTTGPSSQ
jgi:hypothetical protein